LVDHAVHHDIGCDVPKDGVRAMAANDMAQGGVEEFVNEHAELLGGRVLRHELRVEQKATTVGGCGFDFLGDDRFGEERKRGEEGRNVSEMEKKE
jgi:hypothetical protein